MSTPTVTRTELINVLTSTNAGSSGSSTTLYALNSPLITLTNKLVKLSNSSTYNSESS